MGTETGNPSGGAGKGKVPMLYRTCPDCGGKVPSNQSRCPDCGENIKTSKYRREAEREMAGDGFAPERAALNWGVAGGILLIVIAGVWFFLGWQAGIIYYYPPVLAIIGIYGIIKGIAEGNVAGGSRGGRPGRRHRR